MIPVGELSELIQDNEHTIVLVVDGEIERKPMHPANIPLQDIAYVLEQFARAIQGLAGSGRESLEADVPLSLVEIREGSGRYVIASNPRGQQHSTRLIDAIESRNGSVLPPVSRKAVESIFGRAKSKGWKTLGFEMRTGDRLSRNVRFDPIARPFEKPEFGGPATFVAKVMRAGGQVGRHSVEIELAGKQRLYASVKDQELTETLGKRLYRQVELHGDAVWDSETLDIRSFRITGLGKYGGEDADPLAAIDELAVLEKTRWSGIQIANYFDDLRHGSGTE